MKQQFKQDFGLQTTCPLNLHSVTLLGQTIIRLLIFWCIVSVIIKLMLGSVGR